MSLNGGDAGHRDDNKHAGDDDYCGTASHREDNEHAGDDYDDDGANICCASKTLRSETQSIVMIKPVKDC